jgi:hypothetical protein
VGHLVIRRLVPFVLAGCFHPEPVGEIACAPDNWCPPPQACGSDRLCHLPGDVPGDGASVAPNTAFVTSERRPLASFANVEAIDTFCTSLAPNKGTYVAWFSTPTKNAIDRLANHSGWIRADGQPFVTSPTELIAGKVLYPLRIDETGADQGDVLVATATGSDGKYTFGASCFGNTGNADFGTATAAAPWWTSTNNPSVVDCQRQIQFYCFQIDDRPPPQPPAATGRHAFLSSEAIDGGSQRSAMDALCQNEGKTLGGTFVALVGSAGSSPLSRVGVGPPLVRPDGVVFMTGDTHAITAPLDVTRNVTYEDAPVWAGAAMASQPPASIDDDCNNWSTTSGMGRQASSAQTSDKDFGGGGQTICSLNNRLYCVQP